MNRTFLKFSFCQLAWLFVLSALSINQGLAADFPKILNPDEVKAHFMQFKNIHTDQDGRKFSFTIDGNEVQRTCPDCKYETDAGKVTYDPVKNLVCIQFEVITFPDSGCYAVVQTGDFKYEMRKERQGAIFPYTVSNRAQAPEVVMAPGWIPPSDFGNAVLVDLSSYDPGAKKLQAAIDAALKGRKWQKETYSNETMTFAKLKKASQTYKVRIQYCKPLLAIGFVEGYQARGHIWLNNLKRDILRNLGAK